MSSETILIVDDDLQVRKRSVKILKEIADFNIEHAAALKEAQKIIAKTKLRGAILDINLDQKDPENQDGFKLLNQLWEKGEVAWVLLCTGSVSINRFELDEYQPVRVDYIDKGEWTERGFRRRIQALQQGRYADPETHPPLLAKKKKHVPQQAWLGRVLIIDNDQRSLDDIGRVVASTRLEPVYAKNHKEAIGILSSHETFKAVTVDKNLFEVEWLHRWDYRQLQDLLSRIDRLEVPFFIVTKYEDGLDEGLYERYHNLKRILFKDERVFARLEQALATHVIVDIEPLIDRVVLYKAVESVLHYRYQSNANIAISKLGKTPPMIRLAKSMGRESERVTPPFRKVTLDAFETQTKRAEQDELKFREPTLRKRLENEIKDSFTDYVLSNIEAKYNREQDIRKWREPYWPQGSLMGDFWKPRADRFQWWLFMNAFYGPYDRRMMQAALEHLFTVAGRSSYALRDPALNELVDEVEERSSEWLTPRS